MRVLIVDDDPSFRQLMASTLRSVGHEPAAAVDGLDGLEKFTAGSWDLIITDRVMPKMKGDEMVASIKEHSPYVPVILITAFPQGIGHSPLFDAIMTKPFQPKHLVALVSIFDPGNQDSPPSAST